MLQKPKRWHFWVIFSVLFLTLYHIAPTVLYYAKPLDAPIDQARSERIAKEAAERVDFLEQDAKEWLASFCRLLQVKPISLKTEPGAPELVKIAFAKTEEANRFRAYLPRSGALRPFAPSQLSLASFEETGKEVTVLRKIGVRLQDHPELFSLIAPHSEEERQLTLERAAQVASSLAAPSLGARALAAWEKEERQAPPLGELLASLEKLEELFLESSSASQRFLASLTAGKFQDRKQAVAKLSSALEQARDQLKLAESKAEEVESRLVRAEAFLKGHKEALSRGKEPFSKDEFKRLFQERGLDPVPLEGHPLFASLQIDWEKRELVLFWRDDLAPLRENSKTSSAFEQAVLGELARLEWELGENLVSSEGKPVSIPLQKNREAVSYFAFDLQKYAALEEAARIRSLQLLWRPSHPDLQELSLVDAKSYSALSEEQKKFCLVVYAPVSDGGKWAEEEGFPSFPDALYVIPKGLQPLAAAYRNHPNSERAEAFLSDLRKLEKLLGAFGFSFLASKGEGAFEKPFFAEAVLAATREGFSRRGSLPVAFFELSTVKERIRAENRIDTAIHRDLLQEEEEYRHAQIYSRTRFDAPPPARSPFWDYCKLSLRKLLRGDEQRILKWGLDLSGGKSVQIELKDKNGEIVTEEAEIQRGISELVARVNRLGLAEVAARQLGHYVVLDFPGGQNLSAEELIHSSTMQFHVVQEKFSPRHPELGRFVDRFLQEVWNEASVLKQTDADALEIRAKEHLRAAKTEAARALKAAGLDLDLECKAVRLRGDTPREWFGQGHPLLLVFQESALKGSDLEEIRSAYDPSKGNYLSFTVSKTDALDLGRNPQQELFHWTSRYSKENLAGTEEGIVTEGRGWRMAVVLNGTVISAPSLESPLKDSAMISGSFSQREAVRLAADLKAGSLSFLPKIVSEKNISPELGLSDRSQGVFAMGISLALVIGTMLVWYRFAGIVASIAVLCNLLILWAVLQNLGAALTLGGIAGIVLTVGMAVDANVLVFERIKEEYARTKHMASALSAGYKRAFSAIFDSNITTVLAALILLQFQIGPIKSFAINLLIGIFSSMFTALFMTRTFFSWWVAKREKAELKMPRWIEKTDFPFLRYAKKAAYLTAALLLLGAFSLFKEGKNAVGMDFTGGYALELELRGKGDADAVEKALAASGFSPRDIRVKTLSSPQEMRILFSPAVDQEGAPFSGLGQNAEARVEQVFAALEKAQLSLAEETQKNPAWSSMSGQISSEMQLRAFFGLGLALVAMFVYLLFRFEISFAAAALLCLVYDVVLTIALAALCMLFGLPLQFDLSLVAALMTIIGYSINDTIIIFDRIREEQALRPSEPLASVVHRALNATLSRTCMTSGTTLLVLFALVFLGGASLFGFSLILTLGVLVGTLSSWFIASPLALFFENRRISRG